MGWIRWLNFCTRCRSIWLLYGHIGRKGTILAKYFKFGGDWGNIHLSWRWVRNIPCIAYIYRIIVSHSSPTESTRTFMIYEEIKRRKYEYVSVSSENFDYKLVQLKLWAQISTDEWIRPLSLYICICTNQFNPSLISSSHISPRRFHTFTRSRPSNIHTILYNIIWFIMCH